MKIPPPNPSRRLARVVFFVFILTFIASRVLVIAIMRRWMPDLFLHLGGTHVHHLNYGIFLLAAIGGLLLFVRLTDLQKHWAAAAYGFAMALTFDEFGMWMHLGGSYWQRASYDAVIVLTALLGLLAFAPRWSRLGPRHYWALGATLSAVGLFCWLSFHSLNVFERRVEGKLLELEQTGPQ